MVFRARHNAGIWARSRAAGGQDVAARSAVLGKVVEKMLTKDPRQRISSAKFANELLQPGSGGREITPFSDPLLGSLSGVSLHEIKAVHKLRGELDGDDVDLSEIPDHIGGGVALLRIVRASIPSVEYIRTMLAAREKLGSDAIYLQIMEERLSMSTLPGTVEAHAATWQTNDWVATDAEGDLLVYLRWGATNPSRVLAEFSLERYARWLPYRSEARAMLLDQLSRRARKVVCHRILIDVKGVSFAHRKLLPYTKEFISGQGNATNSVFAAAGYILNISSVASSLYNTAAKVFQNEGQRRRTTLMSGDPFDSANFAARFERSALPSDIGGELKTGADGHCCLGVEQPALCDEDAVWAKYVS